MRATVLIVEDNVDYQFICRTILEHVGYDVLQAWDGETGIRMAREFEPTLVFMDLALPVVDGVEATRRLKSDAVTRAIPVVALTACAGLDDQMRALEAGCNAYLVKPVTPARVVEEARRWALPENGEVSRASGDPHPPENAGAWCVTRSYCADDEMRPSAQRTASEGPRG